MLNREEGGGVEVSQRSRGKKSKRGSFVLQDIGPLSKIKFEIMRNKKLVEDIAIIGGLFAVQFVYAGNNVVLSYLMSLGFHPASLIIITSFATFVVLSPLAFVIERYNTYMNECLCNS